MRLIAFLPVFALVLASTSFSFAQTAALDPAALPAAAPAKAKKVARVAPQNASVVVVSNARTVALAGLSVADGEGKAATTLKKPLEPGKSITLKLGAKAGCAFVVNASFADDAPFDETQVDLCADRNLRFTE